jgi:hypothetical protein
VVGRLGGLMRIDGECVGESRDGGRKVAVGRGRATYGERAACCDPAAGGGPVRELPAESSRIERRWRGGRGRD